MKTAELLITLADKNIISGSEKESGLDKFVSEYLSVPAHKIRYDNLGNLTVSLTEGGERHILLEAHADETGFIVTDITENGFVKFSPVGGTYGGSILGNMFTVCGKTELAAVAVTTPPHLAGKEDSELPEVSDVLLDAGLSYEKAKELIRPGDRILRRRTADMLSEYRVAGKALDNRAGVATILLAARHILENGTANRITLAFTSQEEVGTRGAAVVGFNDTPDEAICVDVSFATQPGVSSDEAGELNKGPMLGVSPTLSKTISDGLRDICERESIPYQIEVMSGRTGTDADAIQITAGGIPCGLISIPQRNMHSSCETVDIRDIERAAALISAYCEV